MNSREDYALYIWGKHYPKPTEIKNRVISAAAGENHVVFVTSTQVAIKAIMKITDLDPISLAS